MFNKHVARRIWDHDRSVLDGLWQEYFSDREKNLVRFVSAMYSFRDDPLLRKKLLGMRFDIIKFSSRLTSPEDCDVISTVLEWISRQPEIDSLPVDFGDYALRICARGLRLLPEETGHTKPLLLLTKARLIKDWKGCVERAETAAENVVDVNQRARVFRKIGTLYRLNAEVVEREWWKGVWWGVRAVFVPNITAHVRLKNVAALFVDI